METHQQAKIAHNHAEHAHDHGNMPVFLFFIGLIIYLIALVGSFNYILEDIFFVITMVTAGYHVMLEGVGETITESLRLKRFHPNVHILMTLAALGAAIIGDFDEGALLILIFAGAHFLEEYAEGKSKREITHLLEMNPTEARLILPTGETKLVKVETLTIGDHLQVLPGDKIPTDGSIIEGSSDIDEASISGESIPREKITGDEVFGSTINGKGSFKMEVTKNNEDTVFSKIIELVNQSQSNLSKTATTIKKLEPIYVTIVMIVVPAFILLTPFLVGWSWNTSFYRGMVMLISASPCALAASAVPTTLSGISNLAKQGVLFKGGSYLSNLAKIKACAFDKTGTLTEGKPAVTDHSFINKEKSAYWKDIIVAMEKSANHPLADAILDAFTSDSSIKIDTENEIGKGLVAEHQGKEYRIGKPSTFENVPEEIENQNETLAKAGKTVVYFSENDSVVGLIAMMDLPNKDAKKVIQYFKDQGIHTAMITGDTKLTGEAVGQLIAIDEVIGNVLPENKSEIIHSSQKQYGETVMLGDGINDAPALVASDIGFAMGNGTDVAIDVADAVIMQNDLTKFQYAHKVSKKVDKVVWQNILFSMFIVLLLNGLNLVGKIDIGIGVLAHEGSTLLVILNGLRLLLPVKD
ncbi:heavy metal translocating P-type ATPase [Marinilactibacillus psychrotolerans]|uniref:Cadmium-translocating P-type ATPase n=1 Tax=Marinilactibacillus psychrotolerans TaxID=191770 RepID=A0A5R9C7G6_9LACT|nr:heavy metal translocating P-type ATPase [Marinilactibacillus psychrotolerans]TLQ09164.1 cadmium-translocating P-type ATPase [Marinilactibacillus psychrotolerans]